MSMFTISYAVLSFCLAQNENFGMVKIFCQRNNHYKYRVIPYMKLLILTILLSMTSVHGPHLIYNFNVDSDVSEWKIVNDGVMGGLSQSKIKLSEEGRAVFSGEVSLENNGGFASVRYTPEVAIDAKGMKSLVVKVKGDGKKYQVRLKADAGQDHSHVYEIKTTKELKSYEIPLKKMYPTFRGRKLDMPNFEAETIAEIAFLIGNKKAESFTLELDKMYVY